MAVLGLDVGTTCCKCGLYDNFGNLINIFSADYTTIREKDNQYIDVTALYESVKNIIKQAAKVDFIEGICVSSLGEAFVPVSKNYEILDNAILYTDNKGAEQAEQLISIFGNDEIFKIAGAKAHSMYSLPKMMWLKRHKPDIYSAAYKLLLIGDFVGFMLSGKAVIDYSLASRTLALDISKKDWSEKLLNAAEIDINKLSAVVPSGSIIGNVRQEIADEINIPKSCVIIAGGHDQVCSCIGTGITQSGYSVDGMGTVECITPVFDTPNLDYALGENGYCVVPYILDKYATYIFNYTGGALIKWFKDKIKKGCSYGKSDDFYSYFNSKITDKPTDILFLPHFAGAATPYMDTAAKGAILNLDLSVTDTDIYRAIMESTAYEMRLNMDKVKEHGISINEVTVTGGGAKSKEWLQIKADIFGIPVFPLEVSEAGINGAAMLALNALGHMQSLEKAVEKMVKRKEPFYPRAELSQIYDKKYEKYKKIYNLLKEIR